MVDIHSLTPIDADYKRLVDAELKKSAGDKFNSDHTSILDSFIHKHLGHMIYGFASQVHNKVQNLTDQELLEISEIIDPATQIKLIRPEGWRNQDYWALSILLDYYDPSVMSAETIEQDLSLTQLKIGIDAHNHGVNYRKQYNFNYQREAYFNFRNAQNTQKGFRLLFTNPDKYIHVWDYINSISTSETYQIHKSSIAAAGLTGLDPQKILDLSAAASEIQYQPITLTQIPPHIIQEALLLPVWFQDATITQRLLKSAAIVMHVTSGLVIEAAKVSQQAPLLLSRETARGVDTPLEYALAVMQLEGIVTYIQALNMAAGQLSLTYPDNFTEEQSVQTAFEKSLPSKYAGKLPIANIGPATIMGRYILDFFTLYDDRLIIPTHNKIVKSNAIKSNTRKERANNRYLHPDVYFNRAIDNPVDTITGLSGNIHGCPANQHQSIKLIQEDIYRVYKLLSSNS